MTLLVLAEIFYKISADLTLLIDDMKRRYCFNCRFTLNVYDFIGWSRELEYNAILCTLPLEASKFFELQKELRSQFL